MLKRIITLLLTSVAIGVVGILIISILPLSIVLNYLNAVIAAEIILGLICAFILSYKLGKNAREKILYFMASCFIIALSFIVSLAFLFAYAIRDF